MAADLLERAVQLFELESPATDLVVADWVLCLDEAGEVRERKQSAVTLCAVPSHPKPRHASGSSSRDG